MPRLRLNMEEWGNNVRNSVQADVVTKSKVGVVKGESWGRLEEERNEVEDAIRRQEAKRKVAPGGRKPKGRKLAKLVGWGEPQDELDNTDLGFEVVNRQGVGIFTNDTNHGQFVDLGFGVVIFTHSSGIE